MPNTTKASQDAYEFLKNSPMFKLSLSSKELFHSNFLEWLSTVDMDSFKKLILRMAGVQSGEEIKDWTWGLTWEVKREYNNFDLCIVEGNSQGDIEEVEDSQDGEMSCGEYDEEPQDDVLCGRILFVLENKVKSIPYEDQLERYAKEAEELNRKNFYKEAAKEVNMVKSRIIDNTKLLMGDSFQDWYLKERGRGKNKKWYKWSKDEENWHELNQNVIPNNTVEISVKTYSAKRAEEQKKSQFVIFYCLWLRIFPISLMAMFGKLR